MILIEVADSKTKKQFHKLPHLIYKNDPNWACPLQGMVEDIFTPAKNPSFKTGEAIRWIVTDDNGEVVGRIGAFINRKKAFTFEQPTGGCGFFECMNNLISYFIFHIFKFTTICGKLFMDIHNFFSSFFILECFSLTIHHKLFIRNKC